jgi:retron-type reverse transcriptase
MVVRRLDARLAGQAEKIGWTYTRYADDMTFSAQSEMRSHVGYLVARIRHYAEQEGFALNESKTRVLERNASQRVTGVVVNDRAGVPRKLVRRLRAILHRADGEGLEAQNRFGHHDFPSWVAGMIAYIRMVNQAQGSSLEQAWRGLRERP